MEDASSPRSYCGCNNLFSFLYSLEVLGMQHLLMTKLKGAAIMCSQKQKRHRVGGEDLLTIREWQELEALTIMAL